MTNEIVVEERGLITLETESRKVQVENSLTPRGKLEMLWRIFMDGSYWNQGGDNEIDENIGHILEENTEDYDYGLDVDDYGARTNLVLGTIANENINNSEINVDEKIYNSSWESMEFIDESLPQKDIYKIELFKNIKSDEFEQAEDESKSFDLVMVGDFSSYVGSLYAFLDDAFTVEPYEQLDLTWEIELKLPDVPE